MSVNREIKESPMEQGTDEEIVYTLTTTPWGSSPASISVKAYDITDGGRTEVTTTLFPTNTPTANGDIITLSACKAMTAEKQYRIEVKFTCSGNVFEPYCIINAKY